MSNEKPTDNRAALARIEPTAALAMVQTPSEAEERLRELQDFIKRNMVEGEDYGQIPGTRAEEGKPIRKVLLKPGAEKLAEIYGFAIDYEDARPPIEQWGDDPFFAYFKKAIVTRRSDGRVMGTGIGSCNSREKKYAARWVFEREIPPGVDKSRLPQKQGMGKNDKPYTLYKVPNPEIYDLVNTIEKMAAKRAGVSAVISVTRSSGIFTQDLEDHDPDAGKRKPNVPDADFENAPPARPSSPTVSAEVLAARKRWADPNDGGDAETERTLAGSPDPNDRALVFAFFIEQATTEEALKPIELDLRNGEQHAGLKADMLARVEEKRAQIKARPAA